MHIQASGKSEKGLHLVNQDAFLVGKTIFAVADGVTVSGQGEKASKAAISFFKKGGTDLEKDFFEVNERVFRMGKGKTTLTVAHIEDDNLMVGHVGDSSLFLVRENAQEITESDSREGSDALTQAIGQKRILPHLYRLKIRKGDILVLATDGVAKYLEEREIAETVKKSGLRSPSILISLAKSKPKLYEDDKTVVVVKIT